MDSAKNVNLKLRYQLFANYQDLGAIDNRLDAGLIESGSKLYGTEFMIGFWIIDVPSEQLASELALAGSKACNRKVELRQIFG
jgi:hypothetical protein